MNIDLEVGFWLRAPYFWTAGNDWKSTKSSRYYILPNNFIVYDKNGNKFRYGDVKVGEYYTFNFGKSKICKNVRQYFRVFIYDKNIPRTSDVRFVGASIRKFLVEEALENEKIYDFFFFDKSISVINNIVRVLSDKRSKIIRMIGLIDPKSYNIDNLPEMIFKLKVVGKEINRIAEGKKPSSSEELNAMASKIKFYGDQEPTFKQAKEDYNTLMEETKKFRQKISLGIKNDINPTALSKKIMKMENQQVSEYNKYGVSRFMVADAVINLTDIHPIRTYNGRIKSPGYAKLVHIKEFIHRKLHPIESTDTIYNNTIKILNVMKKDGQIIYTKGKNGGYKLSENLKAKMLNIAKKRIKDNSIYYGFEPWSDGPGTRGTYDSERNIYGGKGRWKDGDIYSKMWEGTGFFDRHIIKNGHQYINPTRSDEGQKLIKEYKETYLLPWVRQKLLPE